MHILFILVALIVIVSSVWIAKRNRDGVKHKSNEAKICTNPDDPVDFGYKIVWIAVKTDNKERIAATMELTETKLANWQTGIGLAYKNDIYITPLIGQWTLIVGTQLATGYLEDINQLETLLNKFSSEFGEAQSFATHRVVEYHHWIKSTKGKIQRSYSYIGESGQNIKVHGNLTEPEIGLNLINTFSSEAKDEGYWEREDLDYADEELVMQIAENWSVNPTKLTMRNDIINELGIIGKWKRNR